MADPSTTRKLIRQKVIKKLYAPHYPIVGTTTALAADTTSVVDSVFAPSGQVEDFNSAFILVPSTGDVSRVTNTDFSGSNSILTVAPAFAGGALASSTEYEVHYAFHPDEINDRINELLENVRGEMLVPLSGLLGEGNFNSDVTIGGFGANWNESDTNMTTAIETTASRILFGDGSLVISDVSAAAITDYVYQRVYVSANTPLLASVYAFVDGSTSAVSAEMEVWDVTNSVQIGESANTTTFNQWVQLTTQMTVPATCKQVEFRLLCSAHATGDVFYDAAALFQRDQRTHDLPSELEWPEDFGLVNFFPRGDAITVGTSTNAYRALQYPMEKWSDAELLRDPRGAVGTRIQLIQNRRDRVGTYYTSSRATPSWSSRSRVGNDIDHPLFVTGRADFPTISSDTTVIYAPEDYIVNLLYADLMEELAQRDLENDKYEGYNLKMSKANDVREKIAFLARNQSDTTVGIRGTFNAGGSGRRGGSV